MSWAAKEVECLRPFLARVLGWSNEHAVELALHSLALALEHCATLTLYGEGDMVPIALALHLRMLGPDSPFVVCDPRRGTKGTAGQPIFCADGVAALKQAVGGSLCINVRRLPSDLPALAARLRDTENVGVICIGQLADSNRLLIRPAPLTLPPLAQRANELDRIIAEYADDAIDDLCVSADNFTHVDLAWVRDHAPTSLAEIAAATLWVVGLRVWHDVPRAARYLGEDPALMSRWFSRRGVRRADDLPAAPPPSPSILHLSGSTLAEIRELSITNPALVERWAQDVEDTLAAMLQKRLPPTVNPGPDEVKR